jgi:glutamate racemase
VEVLIDYLGEVAPEAADLDEIVDACTHYSLHAAELLQQLASFDGPQARNGFEYRLAVTLRPFSPVPRDREPVRFIAHALDQM